MFRSTTTRAFCIVALIAFVAVGVGAAGSAAARARKSCGTIGSPFTSNHRERIVVIRAVRCRTARKVAREFNRMPEGGLARPGGWVCFNGHQPQPELFVCAKGKRGNGGVQNWRHVLEALPT